MAPRPLPNLLALTLALLAPGSALAAPRVGLRVEGSGGTMLSSYQRDALGYGLTLSGALRGVLSLHDAFALQVSGESWYAPGDARDGQAFSLLGGVRGAVRPGARVSLALDVNAGLGLSGGLRRLAADAGLAADFTVTDSLTLGPVLRVGALFATSDDAPHDALFASLGVGASWRVVRPVAPPPILEARDRDGDGLADAQDRCPADPRGDHPDPARPGCPLGDGDGDGVTDDVDRCVDTPAGPSPDAARPGCPRADTDRDGVFDDDDACPTRAMGDAPDPERRGCPDNDQDGDGVTDHRDRCVAVPAGRHPDPARAGCPLPDRDGDSVPDAVDACPTRPGAPSTRQGRNGCPGLVRIERGMIRILRPVFFATRRDTILRQSSAVLAAVADALRADPTLRRVAIEGHTDDVADDAFNLDLSRRRAARVMADLVARGVSSERLRAEGFGETRPVVPGTTAAARAANRRVEFRIESVEAEGGER